MKKLLNSLVFLAATVLAGSAFGYGLSESFFVFNGMWYTGSSSYVQPAGYANGADLGDITTTDGLVLGAEVKSWDENNAKKHLPVLHYCFDYVKDVHEDWHNDLTIPYDSWDGGTGNKFRAEEIDEADLSELTPGPHTISLYISKEFEDDYTVLYDSNNNNNYTADFTLIKVIDVPAAVSGLVYDGGSQTGVAAETGYTLSGNTATDAGSYTATATLDQYYQWSDGTTAAKTISWSIAPADLTVTANAHSITYGDAPANNGVTYSGFVASEDESALSGTLAYAYDYSQYGAVGNAYTITPSGLTSGNYDITFNPGTLTVGAKALTVAADAKAKTYGDADPELTYTSSGLVGGDAFSGALARVAGEAVGTYEIGQGTLTAGGNYSLSYTPANLTIGAKAVTVTADNKSKTYGDADPELTATVAGLVGADTVSYTVSRVAGESVGTYAITPAGDASQGNYAVSYEAGTLTISAAKVAVPAAVGGLVYDGTEQTGVADGTGYTLSGNTATAAGSYTATATPEANYEWDDEPATGTKSVSWSIAQAPLTVAANDITIDHGAAAPDYTYTVTGLVEGESLATAPALACDYAQGDAIGTYPISISGAAASANYSITQELPGTLTVLSKKYTVTFQNEGGTPLQSSEVEWGETPAYTGETPTKAADERYTYTFAGWSPEVAEVTADAVYTATYTWEIREYLISWYNDGEFEFSESYYHGATPWYPRGNGTPTKDDDAEYIYTFDRWSPEIVPVTTDASYNATYTREKRSYWITWLNDDDSLIDETIEEYGEFPTPPDATKAPTAQYTYTFTGWTPAVSNVTGEATYTATYSSTVNEYTITWLNDDDSLIDTTSVAYGTLPAHADATKAETDEWRYTFAGWDPEPVSVTGEATYKATFTPVAKYAVTVAAGIENGSVSVDKATAAEGDTVTVTATPDAGYVLDLIRVNGEKNAGNTFLMPDGAVEVSVAFAPILPYKLVESEDDFTVDADYLVVAVGNGFTNALMNEMVGEKNSTCLVATNVVIDGNFIYSGPRAIVWQIKEAQGYELFNAVSHVYVSALTGSFAELIDEALGEETWWSIDFEGLENPDKTVKIENLRFPNSSLQRNSQSGNPCFSAYANSQVAPRLYKLYQTCTVTFVDEDGTTLDEAETELGKVPVYGGGTPTKAATAQYSYTFAGWSDTVGGSVVDPLPVADTDTTYYAVYDETVNKYTITWLNDDDSLIDTTTVAYGTVPTHAAATKDETPEWRYTFAGWTPEVVSVTGEATYKATYTPVKRSYTITWLDDDGSPIDTTTVEYGVTPTHADASKDPTAQYTYTFTGWSPTPEAVTGTATYTATYSPTVNKYTVTFEDWDGTPITSEDYPYGTAAIDIVLPANPERAATAEYAYTFAEWSPALEEVTEDATYTATYTPTSLAAATWIGGYLGDWDTATNWDIGYLPTSATVVTFTNNAEVGINQALCKEIVLADNAYVTILPASGVSSPLLHFSGNGNYTDAVSGSGTLAVNYIGLFNDNYSGELEIGTAFEILNDITFRGNASGSPAASFAITNKTTISADAWVKSIDKASTLFTEGIDVAKGVTAYMKTLNYGRTKIGYENVTLVANDGEGNPTAIWLMKSGASLDYGAKVVVDADHAADYYVNTREDSLEGATYTVYEALPKPTVVSVSATGATVTGVTSGQRVAPGETLTIGATGLAEGYEAVLVITKHSDASELVNTKELPCVYAMPDYDIDVTMTAVLKTFTVTFEDEDSTELSSDTYTYGTAAADIVQPDPLPTKAADEQYTYTFAGWTPALADVTEDATYTAQYDRTAIKYNVQIASGIQHGRVTADKEQAETGEIVTLSTIPSIGWKLDSFLVDDEPIEGNTFAMPSSDVLVSATFVEGTTYTLVENADDIIMGADYLIVSATSDFSSALKNEANGTGIGLEEVTIEGTSISSDSDAIVWQINAGKSQGQYVLYNAAAGVYAASSDSDADGAQLLADGTAPLAQWTLGTSALPEINFASVSYASRSLQRDGSAANVYFASYSSPQAMPSIYRADWTTVQLVTFEANGGTSPKASVKCVVGRPYWGIWKPTREGHVFLGWFDAPEDGTRVTNGMTVTESASRTLYAYWTDRQTLKLAPNGGTCQPASVECEIGGTYPELPTPVWSGREFVGWFTEIDGGSPVNAGDPVPATKKRTLYAHWKAQTVTFEPNGGTYSVTTAVYTVGGQYSKIYKPTWADHVFLGWFDALEGGERVANGMTVTGDTERPLFAHWEEQPAQQILRFEPNGGTYAAESVVCTVGDKYSKIYKPTWADHVFLGWYDAQEDGARVKNGMTVTEDRERTLYAYWEEASTSSGVGITGFGRKSPVGSRDYRNGGNQEFTLRFEAIAGTVYEVQWADSLDGEWTVLKRWIADKDGETETSVPVNADSPAGFFRLAIPDEE